MSLDLKDVRIKVPAQVDAWLTGMAQVTSRDKGAIARDILVAHVVRNRRACKIAEHMLEIEGLSGSVREDAGCL